MTQLSEFFPLTHAHLVNAAYKWVLKNGSCGVAFKEFKALCSNCEIPDVIGFGNSRSVVIECKVSRADYFADAKKAFRVNPPFGMGLVRYYCTPDDLIKRDELPEGWGLLYVQNNKVRAYHKPLIDKVNSAGHTYRQEYYFERNIKSEHELMYSALRRLHLRGRIDEVYIDPRETVTPLTQ